MFLLGSALIAAAVVGAGTVTWVWVFSGVTDETGVRFAFGWGIVFWVGVVFVMIGAGRL